jgi:type I restriction enzyme M protein
MTTSSEMRRICGGSRSVSRFTLSRAINSSYVNLDIFWLRDEALEDSANLPEPEVLAREIMEDLEAALEQFAGIVEELGED